MREVSDEEVRGIMAAARVAGFWHPKDERHVEQTFDDTKEKLMRGWTIDWENERWVEPKCPK